MDHINLSVEYSADSTYISDRNDACFFHVFIGSLIVSSIIHHIISPWVFRRYNSAYRLLERNRRMEWDSRFLSTIHASTVSVLCLISLLKESQLWNHPMTATGDIAFSALAISAGYFLCDLISMPIYWESKYILIFSVHHLIAMIGDFYILRYKVAAFFGIYRMTTELSTPFTNQRWFFRTIGYTPDRRRVAFVTLIFSLLFSLTRNILVIPYWIIAYNMYNTEEYFAAVGRVASLAYVWFIPAVVLDILNTFWAIQVYPIGYRAALLLYTTDWRTEINLAKARIHHRVQSVRSRAMRTELVTSLRRTASYSRMQHFLKNPSFESDWEEVHEVLSEPEIDTILKIGNMKENAAEAAKLLKIENSCDIIHRKIVEKENR